jgi:hypothetical protein
VSELGATRTGKLERWMKQSSFKRCLRELSFIIQEQMILYLSVLWEGDIDFNLVVEIQPSASWMIQNAFSQYCNIKSIKTVLL